MSTPAAAMSDRCPVQWTGRHAILALPQHAGESNAAQIREELLWVINLIPVYPTLNAAIAAAAPAASVPAERTGAGADR